MVQASAERVTLEQKRIERRNVVLIGMLAVVLVAVAMLELANGASRIDVWTSMQALFGYGTASDVASVQSIRLPLSLIHI